MDPPLIYFCKKVVQLTTEIQGRNLFLEALTRSPSGVGASAGVGIGLGLYKGG
jgi:hypothetical protein